MDKIGKAVAKVTGKEEDGMLPEFRRALILTNLAFVLANVVNMCVLDAETELKSKNMSFRYEDKMNFSKMREALKKADAASLKAARAIFNLKDVDSATNDAEWYYDLLTLCVDRIGENEEKSMMLMSWLKNMQSEEHVIVE